MIPKEMELKSELENEIVKSRKVFIIGHNSPDFDSVGSCFGLHRISDYYGVDAYVIVDDDPSRIEPETRKIIDSYRDRFNIITKKQLLQLLDNNSILIVVDTNKEYMLSVKDILKSFRKVIVIDHHEEDEHTIKTNSRFIFLNASSTSEIIARLLHELNIEYDSDIANYLYAGIRLDTRGFRLKKGGNTHGIAQLLIDSGADPYYVSSLFLEDLESFSRINSLIINGTLMRSFGDAKVALVLNRNKPNTIYQKEDFAKASDRVISLTGIDAAFVLGFIDEGIIHVSARGGTRVDVGKIMKCIKGGGNAQSAGAQIKSNDLLKIEEEIIKHIPLGVGEPPILRKHY